MKKILAVDNDRIMRRFMTKLLEKEGHQVVTAEDGLNALDILKTYTPDVMFVDLVMPNIDGEMLCRIIRDMQKFNDTYLVILSSIAILAPWPKASMAITAATPINIPNIDKKDLALFKRMALND